MEFKEWLKIMEVGPVVGQPINNAMFQANGVRSKISAVEAVPQPSGFNPQCDFEGVNCTKKKRLMKPK